MPNPPTFITNAVAWAKNVHQYLIDLSKWLVNLQKLLKTIDWKKLEQDYGKGPGTEVPSKPPEYP